MSCYDSALTFYKKAAEFTTRYNQKIYINEAIKKIKFELTRELSIKNIKFHWESNRIEKGARCLFISGFIINNTSEHIFDQIYRSIIAEVKFKNGETKTIQNIANTIDKDNIDLKNLLSDAYKKSVKSFLKDDTVLKPDEQRYFTLGDNVFGEVITISKNELLYPIESIELTLIAEARTPLNHLWRGELITTKVPLP